MIVWIKKVRYPISNYFRFQPIDPDTLVYSNEEDDEDVKSLKNSTEKFSRKITLPISSERVLKSEHRKSKNGREKYVSRKEVVPIKISDGGERNVWEGKDLDNISPLIKRLLIDTYKNHTIEEKLKRKRSSRSRKNTDVTYEKDIKETRRRYSDSVHNKWQSALRQKLDRNSSKPVSKILYNDKVYNVKYSSIGNQNVRVLRNTPSKKPFTPLTRQRSQSLEENDDSKQNHSKLNHAWKEVSSKFIVITYSYILLIGN